MTIFCSPRFFLVLFTEKKEVDQLEEEVLPSAGPGRPCICHRRCLKPAEFTRLQRPEQGLVGEVRAGVGTSPWFLLFFLGLCHPPASPLSYWPSYLPASSKLQGQDCIPCDRSQRELSKSANSLNRHQQVPLGVWHCAGLCGTQDE